MHKAIDVIVSLKSWVFLGGMMGFCGGVVFGLGGAVYAILVKHNFAEAGQDLLGSLVSFPIAFAVFALVGYPVYRFAFSKSSRYRTLTVRADPDVS
jgi:hypothetical protein